MAFLNRHLASFCDISQCLSLILSVLMSISSLLLGKWRLASLSLIVCVYLKIRDIQVNGLTPLKMSEASVARLLVVVDV